MMTSSYMSGTAVYCLCTEYTLVYFIIVSLAFSLLADHSVLPLYNKPFRRSTLYNYIVDRIQRRAGAVLRQADLHRLIDRLWTFSILRDNGAAWSDCATLTPFR
ncbi:hypothetical protein BDW42DRAFT_30450 [Aspergillus taichungensis]|uniref:Uncharacterized protein n=1 Tax=Aspergillus taichungensis TaxID=482145 RepID=A0A2J5I4P7_9EURO|nr:hypothetical protein BDW42DRAFT_30450 [Aspergillus taichungensis]